MAEHKAIALGMTPDTFAIFKGYAEALPEGETGILTEGDPVKIVRLEGEENIIVVKVDDDGNEVLDDSNNPIADNLFPDELEPAEMDDATEAAAEAPAAEAAPAPEPEPAPAAKPAAKRTAKAKPAAKAAEPAAAAEPAPAAEEAPAAEKPKPTRRKAAAAKTEEEAPAAEPAPAAAEETKSAITPTPVTTIKDMVSVTEALSENANDALRAAKALVERAEQTDFTLGGVLCKIHETGVFKSLGFDGKRGFDEYVEQTLGIQSRKARYLMTIYTKFAMLGVDEAKLNEIGWSKAKELARIPDAELKKDFNKLVKMAGEKSRDDLIGHIKTKYEVVTRGEQVQLKSFSFKLAEAEALTVEEGLKEACTAIGEQDLNKALAHIVGEWRGHAATSDLDLDAFLELGMARFGLQKISFVDENGEAFDLDPSAEEETETATA